MTMGGIKKIPCVIYKKAVRDFRILPCVKITHNKVNYNCMVNTQGRKARNSGKLFAAAQQIS